MNVTEFAYVTEAGHAYHVTLHTEEVPALDDLMQAVCDIMAKAPDRHDEHMSVDDQNWRAELRAVPNQNSKGLRWHAEVWRKPDTRGAPLHFSNLEDAQTMQISLRNA